MGGEQKQVPHSYTWKTAVQFCNHCATCLQIIRLRRTPESVEKVSWCAMGNDKSQEHLIRCHRQGPAWEWALWRALYLCLRTSGGLDVRRGQATLIGRFRFLGIVTTQTLHVFLGT